MHREMDILQIKKLPVIISKRKSLGKVNFLDFLTGAEGLEPSTCGYKFYQLKCFYLVLIYVNTFGVDVEI